MFGKTCKKYTTTHSLTFVRSGAVIRKFRFTADNKRKYVHCSHTHRHSPSLGSVANELKEIHCDSNSYPYADIHIFGALIPCDDSLSYVCLFVYLFEMSSSFVTFPSKL